ncbi:MAG: thioesterase family protein [Verrucomicrobiota bacterium]
MAISEFSQRQRVEFVETDMAGIMHFSNFFRMMEQTEHAFFRSLGSTVHEKVDGKTIGWPRVEAHCEYLKPLKFEDVVEIVLRIEEIRERSLKMQFQFQKVMKTDGNSEVLEKVARGYLTTVCVELGRKEGQLKSRSIPESFLVQIKEHNDLEMA